MSRTVSTDKVRGINGSNVIRHHMRDNDAATYTGVKFIFDEKQIVTQRVPPFACISTVYQGSTRVRDTFTRELLRKRNNRHQGLSLNQRLKDTGLYRGMIFTVIASIWLTDVHLRIYIIVYPQHLIMTNGRYKFTNFTLCFVMFYVT